MSTPNPVPKKKRPDPELIRYVLIGCGFGACGMILLGLLYWLLVFISVTFGGGWAAFTFFIMASTATGGLLAGIKWHNKKHY